MGLTTQQGVLHWHQVGGFSWVEPSEALWSGWGS